MSPVGVGSVLLVVERLLILYILSIIKVILAWFVEVIYILPRWFRYLVMFSVLSLVAYLIDAYIINLTGFLIGGLITLIIYLERR